MRDLLQRPDLFSINTATLGYKTPLPAIIDACAARGIGAIAPWRRELQGEDLQQIARQLAASKMNVSGLCRSTYYTAPTLAERKLAIDDNRRALDDAAVLNAACYMQVVGGLPTGTKDLYEAREQVKQGHSPVAATFERCRRANCTGAAAPDDRSRSFLSVHVTSGAGLV
ncbi:hypothetical protein VEE68_13930 [Escherichia coli]|nr:hypothetical protein VEE68_13930 [Escherichia coli]